MIFEKQVERLYRARLFARADDRGTAFYFSHTDFEGLLREPFAFSSVHGERLQGYFYQYADPIPGRVIVFDHGIGGGHRSYMKEIEQLARHGYRVFAYDHTGCMESEGAGTNGFAQSVADLDACLTALMAEPSCKACSFSVIGHSWGGFAVLNVAAFHPEVTHVVGIAGAISVEAIHAQSFGGVLRPYRRVAERLERASNPEYVNCTAADALQKTKAKLLVLHSEDDRMVSYRLNFLPLQRALADRPNSRFVSMQGKGHNPNYTVGAVQYKDAYLKRLAKLLKKGKLQTDAQKQAFLAEFDWNRMTEQDSEIWEIILQALDG